MLRGLVVLHLIVATLVGPRPCPCPASVTAAAPASPASSAPTGGVPRSCGCCTPTGLTADTVSQAPRPQRPDQPPVPCPCRCGKPDTAAGVWAARSSTDHDGSHVPVSDFAVPCLPPVQHVFGVGQLRDRPFCSTDHLLYAFHRLRC